MSILIDPYMFELTEESEINGNIPFFQAIISLCNHPEPKNRISLLLYKGILDRMHQRELQPFPISLDKVRDAELKRTLIQINNSFSNVLLNYIEEVELDGCAGEQLFSISGLEEENIKFEEDDHYFEMLYTLLIPCYKKELSIDSRILTGQKREGRQINDEFSIACNCATESYSNRYIFVGIDEFIPVQDKLLKKLKQMKREDKIPIAERVKASTNGDHHNHVTASGKKFNYLNDLSLKNRMVLQQLGQLGLYEVKFGEFRSEPGKTIGSMSIQTVEENATLDILNVRFFAETGFAIATALYFPKGVGRIIHDYFEKGQLAYQNVSRLVEKIK